MSRKTGNLRRQRFPAATVDWRTATDVQPHKGCWRKGNLAAASCLSSDTRNKAASLQSTPMPVNQVLMTRRAGSAFTRRVRVSFDLQESSCRDRQSLSCKTLPLFPHELCVCPCLYARLPGERLLSMAARITANRGRAAATAACVQRGDQRERERGRERDVDDTDALPSCLPASRCFGEASGARGSCLTTTACYCVPALAAAAST